MALWISLSIVFGIFLGAGGMFGWMTLQQLARDAEIAAEEAKLQPVALDGELWFDEADTLPSTATPPGSTLTLGQAANILVSSAENTRAVVSVAVESIAPLSAEQTELLRSLQPALAGQTLYRIDILVTPPSDDDLVGLRIGDGITPITAEGERMMRVPVEGWNACGNVAIPAAPADNPQAPRALCVVGAAPEGSMVVGAQFAQPGGPYSVTIDGQVTWLP